jgi:hypothetical protein
MGQTYTAVYAGNAVYTVALADYHPAAPVAVTVTATLPEQYIGPVARNGLATSSYAGSSGQETLALGTSPDFTGSGTAGFADGSLTAAQFSWPDGVALDGAGNLYVGASANNRIRKIVP